MTRFMPGRTRSFVAASAAACAGLSLWCSLGALAFTGAGSGAARVGLLPPLWLLALLVASLGTAAFFLRLPRSWSLPLFTSLVLVVPWLPGRVPDAWLVWTGHAVWWVWTGIGVAVLSLALTAGRTSPDGGAGEELVAAPPRSRTPGSRPAALCLRAVPWLVDPVRGALTAGLLAACVYAGVAWKLAPLFPGGDEPHYLVIAGSLLRDHDLQIENNHRRGDYRAYFRGPLAPDFLQRGRNGQIYSIHAPGLPALVLPAFALGGYRGVEVFLVLIAACATAFAWRAGLALAGTAGAAWFGWAALALSAPFLFHAFAVYPEVTGALLVAIAIVVLIALEAQAGGGREAEGGGREVEHGRREAAGGGGEAEGGRRAAEATPVPAAARGFSPASGGRGRMFLLGAGLALLPWLHTRYAVLAGVLGAILLLRLLGRPRGVGRALAFVAVPVAGAIAWFAFFYLVYGTISPAAPYGRVSQSRLAYVPVAFPALLFDQQFGLVPNAPVYFAGFLGLFGLVRWRPRLGVELLLVTFGYLLVAGSFRMWWGGQSAPARFTVPVLPIVAAGAACAWAAASRATRVFLAAALVATVLVSGALVFGDGGWLIFNDRRNGGYALWLDWLTPLVDLPAALPSFIRGRPEPALRDAAVWLAWLGVAWLAVRRVASRLAGAPRAGSPGRGAAGRFAAPGAPVATFGICAMALATVASLWGVWTLTGRHGATAGSAQIALLARANSPLLTLGVLYEPWSFSRPEAVVRRLEIGDALRPARPGRDGSLLSLGPLPAGLYVLEGDLHARADGVLRVMTVGKSPSSEECPVRVLGAGPGATRASGCPVRLEQPVTSLTVQGDEEARRSVGRLALRPIVVGSR
jgi:hypothetical protein